jgi:hypothetical protein
MSEFRQGGIVRSDGRAAPTIELTAPAHGPNLLERTVRTVMHVLAGITLLLASVLMVLALIGYATIRHRISELNDSVTPDPVPSVTGCPFGPDQCGG